MSDAINAAITELNSINGKMEDLITQVAVDKKVDYTNTNTNKTEKLDIDNIGASLAIADSTNKHQTAASTVTKSAKEKQNVEQKLGNIA